MCIVYTQVSLLYHHMDAGMVHTCVDSTCNNVLINILMKASNTLRISCTVVSKIHDYHGIYLYLVGLNK